LQWQFNTEQQKEAGLLLSEHVQTLPLLGLTSISLGFCFAYAAKMLREEWMLLYAM